MHNAISSGHLAGDGPYSRQCELLLSQALGGSRVLLTPSCTAALEIAALLLDVEAGDRVVVPAFTFVSTINAFALRGAVPVFVDIRSDTLNIDERLLEAALRQKVKAIVAVHYAGVGCEMDYICDLAEERGVPIVEDNAHGIFASYKGRPLGSIGRFSTYSFHETKNVTCGEGGALVLNDPADASRAEIIREKGTDRSRFFRGEVDKYTWVDLGSSQLPSELQAAFLYGQLEAAERIQAQRALIWYRYQGELIEWAALNNVQLPVVPPGCDPAYHLFHLLLPTEPDRDRLIAHLADCGVHAVFHYLPLHLSPMGRRLGGQPGDCPVTESVSGRLVRLPMYAGLTQDEQQRVIAGVTAFRTRSR
jgi:dTDP-4-amino-4,6-dideoxygalactose transaminase